MLLNAAMIAQSHPKRKQGIRPEIEDFLQGLLDCKRAEQREKKRKKRTGPSSDGPVLIGDAQERS